MMKKLKLIGAALGAVGVLLSLLLPRACERLASDPPDTLVEDIRSGKLTVSDIEEIRFLEERPGLGVGPAVHSITSATDIAQVFSDLAVALAPGLYRGHQWKNHPATLYWGHDIEIMLTAGAKYTFDYTVAHNWYQEEYYFSVLRVRPRILPVASEREAWKRDWFGTGIGPSVNYEGRAFVEFVRKHDPFFPEDLKRKTGPNKTIDSDEE